MIDISIRVDRAPFVRVLGARRFHVFVNLFLKIDTGFTKRTNHDIRTNTGAFRHVPARIIERDVRRIVTSRDTGLGDCPVKHLFELS